MSRKCLFGIRSMFLVAVVFMAVAAVAVEPMPGKAADAKRDTATPKKDPPRKKKTLPKPFTLSKKTTYITEPLRKDGFPDYIAALNKMFSKGVTPENNAAVLLLKAAGPSDISEKARKRHFAMLGIPDLPEKGDYFISEYQFIKRLTQAKKIPPEGKEVAEEGSLEKKYNDEFNNVIIKRPWSKKEFPHWADWLAANEKPLALVAEAVRRPRYYEPLISGGDSAHDMVISILFPGPQHSRDFAKALQARAFLRSQEGDFEGAWADIMSCCRLGRQIRSGPTILEGLIGIVIESLAMNVEQALLRQGKLSAEQLRKMQTDLAQLPPLSKMADKINLTERIMFLDLALTFARGKTDLRSFFSFVDHKNDYDSVFNKLQSSFMLSLDWDIVLSMGNVWYDRLVAAGNKPNKAERKIAITECNADIKKLAASGRNPKSVTLLMVGDRKAASELMGKILVSLLLPAVHCVYDAEDRMEMQLAEMDLAYALAFYRLDHGSYPATLDDLAPKCIAKVPVDFFNEGRPLQYRREKDGYLLYSFGSNGKDDGGKGFNDRTDNNGGDCDDLTIRMGSAKK